MFITLLVVTFALATATAALVAQLFAAPIDKLLARLVTEDLAPVWRRYVTFAVYVVGIGGGVRVWEVEKYVTPDKEGVTLALTDDRWVIEIYKTVIGALQSTAWMLLFFFLFALLAYVVVRGFELKHSANRPPA